MLKASTNTVGCTVIDKYECECNYVDVHKRKPVFYLFSCLYVRGLLTFLLNSVLILSLS